MGLAAVHPLLISMNASMKCFASDFASLADLAAYQKAKKNGLSDRRAFALGDNGIGCFGDLTAQIHTPMCALPPETMVEWFGSVLKAKHMRVKVVDGITGQFITCVIADRMPARKNITNGCGIDLNPAALLALGLISPIKRSVTISKA